MADSKNVFPAAWEVAERSPDDEYAEPKSQSTPEPKPPSVPPVPLVTEWGRRDSQLPTHVTDLGDHPTTTPPSSPPQSSAPQSSISASTSSLPPGLLSPEEQPHSKQTSSTALPQPLAIEELFDPDPPNSIPLKDVAPFLADAPPSSSQSTPEAQAENADTVNLEACFTLAIFDIDNPRSYLLQDGMYTIGRDRGNTIPLPNRYVSRRHAYLLRVPNREDVSAGDTYCIVDGNRKGGSSTNGILVNGNRIATHYLKSGDVIHFGPEVKGSFLKVIPVKTQTKRATIG